MMGKHLGRGCTWLQSDDGAVWLMERLVANGGGTRKRGDGLWAAMWMQRAERGLLVRQWARRAGVGSLCAHGWQEASMALP